MLGSVDDQGSLFGVELFLDGLFEGDESSFYARMAELPPDDRSPRLRGDHVSYGTTTTEQGSAVVHR